MRIFPIEIEESDWVSPKGIQHKKMARGGIRVCVDFQNINVAACVHDPFPTPFSDEVLDQAVGKEAYSFTERFSRYHHQVRIVKEYNFRHGVGFLCLQCHAIRPEERPSSLL